MKLLVTVKNQKNIKIRKTHLQSPNLCLVKNVKDRRSTFLFRAKGKGQKDGIKNSFGFFLAIVHMGRGCLHTKGERTHMCEERAHLELRETYDSQLPGILL